MAKLLLVVDEKLPHTCPVHDTFLAKVCFYLQEFITPEVRSSARLALPLKG
jgi:hypothetical protein